MIPNKIKNKFFKSSYHLQIFRAQHPKPTKKKQSILFSFLSLQAQKIRKLYYRHDHTNLPIKRKSFI